MLIHGSCHCGNITFVLDWHGTPTAIPARACGCAFCRKHGSVWTSCVDGALRVRVKSPEHVTGYAFETRTAEFQICADCGAVPLVTSQIDGQLYAVVNVNAFDNVDPALLQHAPVSHAGESAEQRLARRQRHWIGQVDYAIASD